MEVNCCVLFSLSLSSTFKNAKCTQSPRLSAWSTCGTSLSPPHVVWEGNKGTQMHKRKGKNLGRGLSKEWRLLGCLVPGGRWWATSQPKLTQTHIHTNTQYTHTQAHIQREQRATKRVKSGQVTLSQKAKKNKGMRRKKKKTANAINGRMIHSLSNKMMVTASSKLLHSVF